MSLLVAACSLLLQMAGVQPAAHGHTISTSSRQLQQVAESLGVPAAPQQPLSVEARDPAGNLTAGVYGYISVGWLVVQMLWVHEAHRKKGLARSILGQLEAQALGSGVHRSRLDIVGSIEALSFYERRGYTIYSTLPVTLPSGREDINYFMKKNLGDGQPQSSESSVS